MAKDLDCVLCGSCVVDILVRPVPLEHPIGGGRLLHAEPIRVTTGGIVSNAGVTMARLGMRSAAFSYVGNDDWAPVIRRRYESEGVDCRGLLTHPTAATSTTAVLIDPSGERSLAHCVGAPKLMDKFLFLEHLDLFARSRMMLIGYYSLMPNLENDLPEVLAAIRRTGCQTAIDAAGDGGGMTPLDRILPHVDVYVPSYHEGVHQTGFDDPRRILDAYRQCGAPGLLGVKLGSKGAMLSPAAGQYVEIDCVPAPGPVVDTTGAGDCFFAGLLTGLLRGMDVAAAGRLAAATGACCVTGCGATTGIRDFNETAALADACFANP
ncbi:MAG: carbohydrate kinase family protein [Planctomycetaceae bacterium]|nr:carbohydrate kinase family protein [Planctomycetaceae bacterium]